MISPFAPHTAEELWQMLGHPGGAGAGGVAGVRPRGRQGRRGRRAGADQRQGPRAPHRARRPVRRRAARAGAGRPGGQDAHDRQDDPQSGGREGAAGQRGGCDEDATRRRSGACSVGSAAFVLRCCVLGAGCGYALAGRGSFLPAYIRTIGIPTFTNRTTVFNLETLLTQKVRSEFIGRGSYQILPEADRRRRAADRRGHGGVDHAGQLQHRSSSPRAT